jgi:hypothetical protein
MKQLNSRPLHPGRDKYYRPAYLRRRGRRIARQSHDQLVRWARGIVTGDLLVPDGSFEWSSSLMLFADHLRQFDNLGMIVVPLAPHTAGYWVNGVAPGVTMKIEVVPREQVAELIDLADKMYGALHPEEI